MAAESIVSADHPPAWIPTGPWSLLMRGVRLAHDPRKLVLAAIGVALFLLGDRALQVLQAPDPPRGIGVEAPRLPSIAEGPAAIPEAAARLADPAAAFAALMRSLFDPLRDPAHFGLTAARILWYLLIWAILGGAIARMAVVELSGRDHPGLLPAARYALRRAPALVAAPLCPFVGILVFALFAAPIGLIDRLPAVGPTLGRVLGFVPLLVGIPMALLTLWLIVAWPLMVVTVVAEDEDVFDALSRSYSYATQRFARLVGLVVLFAILGTIGVLIVGFVAQLVARMAAWGIALGGPSWASRAWVLRAPPEHGAAAQTFWPLVLDYLAYAWVFAAFWSAASAIYLLLRGDVDGTPIEDIDIEAPANS
jgi:hypothetical protein